MNKFTNTEIIEAEIIDDSGAQNSSYRNYVKYTKRPKDNGLVGVWVLSIIAVFTSLIPIVGFIIALIALGACLIKKIPPVLPVIALIISSFITCAAFFIWAFLAAIF